LQDAEVLFLFAWPRFPVRAARSSVHWEANPGDRPLTYFCFGEFVLALDERKLTRQGEELSLSARAFDLLSVLVTNRHRVLTKEELLDAVWPDITVEAGNLTVQVSALRKAVGPKALATIPGRGYQFVLSVQEDAPVPTPKARTPANLNPKVLVLPFSNTSNDPDQEYFSVGITEDIITGLSKVAALSVVARNTAFTFKGGSRTAYATDPRDRRQRSEVRQSTAHKRSAG
jgi:adenylate cyclase